MRFVSGCGTDRQTAGHVPDIILGSQAIITSTQSSGCIEGQHSRAVAYLMITHDISIARAFEVLRVPSLAYIQRLLATVPALG